MSRLTLHRTKARDGRELPVWVTRLNGMATVTHVVDVRPWLEVKRAAIRAHRSQLEADGPVPRNIELLTRLPALVLSRAIGTERFYDPARPPGSPVSSHLWW